MLSGLLTAPKLAVLLLKLSNSLMRAYQRKQDVDHGMLIAWKQAHDEGREILERADAALARLDADPESAVELRDKFDKLNERSRDHT